MTIQEINQRFGDCLDFLRPNIKQEQAFEILVPKQF